MGSATREALASTISVLGALPGTPDLATGEQLLDAGRVIGGSAQLRAALADDSSANEVKTALVRSLFASFTPDARALLESIVAGRWSSDTDLLAGIEEVGIRVLAESAPAEVSLEAELFAFERAVDSDSELELAVGSKLGSSDSKAQLVGNLLNGKASDQTVAILRHLVRQPRGRRIGELLRFATSVVADQAGLLVATVISATPIAAEQLERLGAQLAVRYGRQLRINSRIDADLIGGVRVQIGGDVIDGSVATKLNDLRLQLAR